MSACCSRKRAAKPSCRACMNALSPLPPPAPQRAAVAARRAQVPSPMSRATSGPRPVCAPPAPSRAGPRVRAAASRGPHPDASASGPRRPRYTRIDSGYCQFSRWSMTVMRPGAMPASSTSSASTATSGSSLVSCPTSTMQSPACESASAVVVLHLAAHQAVGLRAQGASRATPPAAPVHVTTRASTREKSPHTRGARPNTDVQRAESCPTVSGPVLAAHRAHLPVALAARTRQGHEHLPLERQVQQVGQHARGAGGSRRGRCGAPSAPRRTSTAAHTTEPACAGNAWAGPERLGRLQVRRVGASPARWRRARLPPARLPAWGRAPPPLSPPAPRGVAHRHARAGPSPPRRPRAPWTGAPPPARPTVHVETGLDKGPEARLLSASCFFFVAVIRTSYSVSYAPGTRPPPTRRRAPRTARPAAQAGARHTSMVMLRRSPSCVGTVTVS